MAGTRLQQPRGVGLATGCALPSDRMKLHAMWSVQVENVESWTAGDASPLFLLHNDHESI